MGNISLSNDNVNERLQGLFKLKLAEMFARCYHYSFKREVNSQQRQMFEDKLFNSTTFLRPAEQLCANVTTSVNCHQNLE